MSQRLPALAGLLGGLLLVLRLGLVEADVVAADDAGGTTLLAAGLGLLGIAALAAGLRLVPRAALWLQAVVGVGCLLLAVSVALVVRGDGDSAVVDGAVGGAVALLCLVLVVRGRGRGADAADEEPVAEPEPEPGVPAVVVRGSHAAASRRGRRRAR